jgi:lauroyl/myristoyl acyltransferase
MFPTGAVALALASGAPIIPVFTVMQKNGRYLAWMEEPIYVRREQGKTARDLYQEKTQEIAAIFEKAISRYPDQLYHFFDYWDRYADKDFTAGSTP